MDSLPQSTDKAINILADAGAHFVLCNPDKKPRWSGWNTRWPAASTAAIHRALQVGPVGVIPFSLDSTALDIDRGDPSELFRVHPPWAILPTKRRGGRHAYYDDDKARGNADWDLLGCGGQVRGGRGYVVLHEPDGPERLAEALTRRVHGERPWPRDLWELAGLPRLDPIVVPMVENPSCFRRSRVRRARQSCTWKRSITGARNKALFNLGRLWAYVQNKGADERGWYERVLGHLLGQNTRFPVPLGEDEVVSTSWSISSWTWNGGGAFDHCFVKQSRRGVASAKVRRYHSYERDLAIVARLDAGETQQATAREFGVSQNTVQTARDRLSRPRRAPKGVCVGD